MLTTEISENDDMYLGNRYIPNTAPENSRRRRRPGRCRYSWPDATGDAHRPDRAQVIEHRPRRRLPSKRLVVAYIDPDPAGIGLALGQNRNRGVVPMQSFGAQHIGFETLEQRHRRRPAAADLVGQGRQTDRHAFLGIALRLPVERLMLAKLLEQHHRKQARSGPAAGEDMERCRGLADLLAITAGELFPDVLDHLPGFRDHLQRLGDVLTQLGYRNQELKAVA
jgi:hypothetical protein